MATLGEAVIEIVADTSQFRKDLQEGAGNSARSISDIGKKVSSVGSTLTKGVTLPVVGVGVAMVKTAADFDSSMNKVKAVTQASGGEFDKMRQQAIDLGASTAFSASEAADGMKYLGQAGFDTNEIMSAMPGTLDLAAASATDLGTTADIMSNILTGFGENADQAGRYADVLAQTAAKSNTDLTQLGDAMKYVAPVAKSAGYSMEETSAIIGQLSNAGIQGCYDGETDVLVRRDGVSRWVSWADARASDEYATVNPLTQGIEWQRPTRMIRYRHTGQMYRVRNRNVDLMVTPDHRMWVQPRADTDRSGRRVGGDTTDGTAGGYRDMRAHEVAGLPVRYLTGGLGWVGESPDTVTIDGFDQWRGNWWKRVDKVEVNAEAWAEFLGWYVTEGSCRHGREGYQTRITQNPGPVRDRMRVTLARLPWTVYEDTDGFTVGGEHCYRQVADLGKAPEKHLPGYVFDWGTDLLQIVMDTIVEGDGDQNGAVYTTSPRLRDDVQTLALLLGYSTTVVDRQQVGDIATMPDGRTVTARHRGWKVNVRRGQHQPWHDPYRTRGVHGARQRPEANRATGSDGFTGDGWVDYDEDVFCAEVPNSLLLVRRGGKVVVSGNSMAGTTLRGSITKLLSPTKASAKAMENLGLKVTDSQGQLKPMDDIIQQLANSGATTADYMKIFGQRAGPGMAALVEQGSKGLQDLQGDLENAGGTAKDMAETQLSGLKGDLEELGGAWESLSIAVSDAGLVDMVSGAVKAVTSMVQALGKLDPAVLKTATAIGLVAAAIGPFLIVTGKVITAVGTIRTAMTTMRMIFTGSTTAVTGLGTASTVAATGTTALGTASRTAATGTTALGTASRTAATGTTALGTASKTATTGVSGLGRAAKIAGGVAGLAGLGTSMVAAKQEGISFGGVMSGAVSGAMLGMAFGPIGALIGAGAGGGLTALAGAFSDSGDEAKKQQQILAQTQAQAAAKAAYDALKQSLDQVSGAYTASTKSATYAQLQEQGAFKAAEKLGVSRRTVVQATMGNAKAERRLAAAMFESNGLQTRYKDGAKELDAAIRSVGGSLGDASDDIREEQVALGNLNKVLGISKQQLSGWPTKLQTRLEHNFPETLGELKQVAQGIKGVSNRQIKIIMKSAGIPVTKKNIAEVREAMNRVDKAKPPTLNAWRAGLNKSMSQALGQTKQKGKQVRRNIEQPPSNARPRLGKFNADLAKQTNRAAKTARNGGQRIRQNVEKPPSKADARLGKFVSGVVKDMRRAAKQAQRGGQDVRKNVEKPTRAAKPDLGRFNSGVSKETGKAKKTASKAGSDISRSLSRGTKAAKPNLSGFTSGVRKSTSQASQTASTGGKKIAKSLGDGTKSARANLSGFTGSIRTGLAGATVTASSGGYGVGQAIASGAKSGVNAAAGGVASAAASMVSNAIAAAKRAAKAKSPSRVTYQLGLDIDAGLRLGIRAGSKEVSRQGWQLMTNLLRQMSKGADVTKYFGRASDAIGKQYDKAFDAAEKARSKAEKKAEKKYQPGKGASKARKKLLAKREKDAKKAAATRQKNANKSAKATRDRQNRQLKATQKYFTRLQAEYNKHAAKLKELRQARSSMISDVQSSFVGELDLTITPGGTFQNVASVVKAQAQKAKQFASLAKQALKAGIPKGLVQTVLGYGSEQGIPLFKSLISGSKTQIKALSADYAAISSYGKQAGTALGDAFYNTGIAAQEGLIRGLLNRKGIKSMSTRLAKQLTAEVKRALGIRSPSKVMEVQVGIPTGQGIMVGAEKAVGQGVGRLSSRVSAVQPIQPARRSYAPTPVATAQPVASATGVAPTQITQVFTGPTTSGGRLAQLDWTIRYASNARRGRWDGVAR